MLVGPVHQGLDVQPAGTSEIQHPHLNGRFAPQPAVPDRLISRAYCLFAALSLDDLRTLVFGDLA